MKNNNKEFFNIQLFAEGQQGAGEAQGVAGTPSEPAKPDYEKEFKALQEKYNSLNADYMKKSDAYDKVSSENADYKRKERDKLSDEEKRNQEFQELIESKKKMEAEIATFKLEKELADNGFSVDERKIFMEEGLNPASFAKILKNRIDETVKSVKASMIKDTTQTSPLGDGTTSGPAKSAFKIWDEKQDNNSVKKVEL